MSKAGLRNHRTAVIGGALLCLLYGAALFAGFLAPYSPDTEFREHFYHPPSRVHFRDPAGNWRWPYVLQTHLTDPAKHHFTEGAPLRIAFEQTAENQNPFVAEWIERPLARIKNVDGAILGVIDHARESSEDSGVFVGMTTIKPAGSNLLVLQLSMQECNLLLKNENYTLDPDCNKVHLLDEAGKQVDEIQMRVDQFSLRFFTSGDQYKLFGIIPTGLHLVSVKSPAHLFLLGTDQNGRDVFSRVLHGARVSLTIGLLGVFISSILGLWIGSLAGYYGGVIDSVLMRSADVILSLPALYLILAVRNVFPTDFPSQATYTLIVVVLSLTGWAGMARVIRGMVLSLREREFILSARSMGASFFRIFLRHLLPNTFGHVMVRAALLVPAYILAEVTLSYLGIGIQEPLASWGNMLSAAQEVRVLEQFSWILAPGAFLFLTVLGFHFLADGLRDANRS